MAEFTLDFGAKVDLLTKGEVDSSLAHSNEAMIAAQLRGIKHLRLPRLRGAVSGSAVTLGILPPQSGPDQGYLWSIIRLTVNGLASGTTPDTLGFYRSGTSGDFLWALNGNTPYTGFGRGVLTLDGGDTLVAANIGNLAATGMITVSGEAWEVPAEMTGKLA